MFHNTSWIHFIFTHLMNNFQKVCHVSRCFKNSKIWIFAEFFTYLVMTQHIVFLPPLDVRYIRITLNAPDFCWSYLIFGMEIAPMKKMCWVYNIMFSVRFCRCVRVRRYDFCFGWPWPKVTAVSLINKNLLVCRIKWEPFNQSLQHLVAIFLWAWSSPD